MNHIRQAPCDCYIDDDCLMACPLHAAVGRILEVLEEAELILIRSVKEKLPDEKR